MRTTTTREFPRIRQLTKRQSATILSFALAAACSAGTTGPEPLRTSSDPTTSNPALHQFTAPAQYDLWWELTKSCSGLDRDISGVRFYTEPATDLHPADATTASVAGEWSASTNSITLTDAAVTSGPVVRHEMLHALLVAGGHPADQFVRACGGYVNCEGACAASVGDEPPVSSYAEHVSRNEVEVTQRLVPSVIDLARDPDGWFALIVEVHNPRSDAVQVRLTPQAGRAEVSPTIGYAGRRVSHQQYVQGALLPLRAGETQRMVYDLRATDFVRENGSLVIRGFFNADSLPELTLQLR